MTPQDKSRPPDASESHFGIDELFFSRTDAAGVIQYGNAVFQRVAAYGWDELLNKPHKLVRHPDTPRAVFWLLWDTIKRGAPIGAYVKNRAKDGRHYWVFAIVTPIDGGYLSVRLKPSSDLFAIAQHVYPALAASERREALAPAESAQTLLAQIRGLGFDNYSAFMAAALGRELAARDRSLGRPQDHAILRFEDLARDAKEIAQHADAIGRAYDLSANVPLNFRVLAAQLGAEGAAIGVISNNYGVLSAEMRTVLDQFATSAREVAHAIGDGYFLTCTARIQRELLSFFASEPEHTAMPRTREMALLDAQQQEYCARARNGLEDIARKARGFHQSCLEMNRLAAGLEVMRVMGKVECARHVEVKARVDELLSDLEAFQRSIASALRLLEIVNQRVVREAATLLAAAA